MKVLQPRLIFGGDNGSIAGVGVKNIDISIISSEVETGSVARNVSHIPGEDGLGKSSSTVPCNTIAGAMTGSTVADIVSVSGTESFGTIGSAVSNNAIVGGAASFITVDISGVSGIRFLERYDRTLETAAGGNISNTVVGNDVDVTNRKDNNNHRNKVMKLR